MREWSLGTRKPEQAGAIKVRVKVNQVPPEGAGVLATIDTTGHDLRMGNNVAVDRRFVKREWDPRRRLTALNPATKAAGGPTFHLQVEGANFVPGSVVHWNGAARRTTYGDDAHLSAVIPAADLAKPAVAKVTVVNPAPDGRTSNALTFTVANACTVGEPDNPRATVPFARYNTVEYRAFCVAGDEDWLKLYTIDSLTYRIETLELATGVNTVASIVDEERKVLVAEGRDAATPANSLIAWKPAASGWVYLRLRNRTASAAGPSHSYGVRFTFVD